MSSLMRVKKASIRLLKTLGHQTGLIRTSKMLMLVPYIVSCSVISCSIPNLFVQMISATLPSGTKQSDQFYLSMLVLTAVGVGELCGGLVSGQIIKRTKSNRAAILYFGIMISIASIMLIVNSSIFKYNYSAYAWGLMWGLTDSGLSSHCGMILGFEFGEHSVAAMGLLNIIKSIVMGSLSFVTTYISSWHQYLIWFCFWWVFFICSFTLLYIKFPFKQK